MTVTDVGAVEAMGPVDYLLIEFPPDRQEFTGEMAEELGRLSESGVVRLLRVLIAYKDDTGRVTVRSVMTPSESGGATAMAGDVASIMANDDLVRVTEGTPPGTVVGVVVWENSWAAAFVAAARRAGGQAVASGRIPAA